MAFLHFYAFLCLVTGRPGGGYGRGTTRAPPHVASGLPFLRPAEWKDSALRGVALSTVVTLNTESSHVVTFVSLVPFVSISCYRILELILITESLTFHF